MTATVFDPLDPTAVDFFTEHGWLLTCLLNPAEVADLRSWVDDIAGAEGGWLHYREAADTGPQLCRTEYLIDHHAPLRALLTTGAMVAAASALLGCPAVLYKEKINYKLPGGAGYSPHQDAPAYPFIAEHISCMVAIDDADETNGCLEVVSGHHHEVLPADDRGCIRPDIAASLSWEPAPVAAGQTLWFHSRTPHRSQANRSSLPRRALYPTYNAASEGDLRQTYYERKLDEFAAGPGAADRVQVSLIGDFEGRPVT